MRVSQGLTEDGIVVGNTYDKYNSRNPIVRLLMRGFERSLTALVEEVRPREIHEVGCGEGYWTLRWRAQGIQARGSDFSRVAVELARANARERDIEGGIFEVCNIYDLRAERHPQHVDVAGHGTHRDHLLAGAGGQCDRDHSPVVDEQAVDRLWERHLFPAVRDGHRGGAGGSRLAGRAATAQQHRADHDHRNQPKGLCHDKTPHCRFTAGSASASSR